MFKFFRKRQRKPSVMYGVFEKMSSAIESRQRKAADYLNRKTARLTGKQIKTGLFLFCGLFGGGAIYVTSQAFHEPATVIQAMPITVPDHAIMPDWEPAKDGQLTSKEIADIRSFQQYLDSLQQTSEGKAIYDSIARQRPGLLDSLAFIQQFYKEQLK